MDKIRQIPAKMLSMKKAAKSGNKQKQKEVNAECERLEKEQEERHRQETAGCSQSTAPKPEEVVDAAAPIVEDVAEEEGSSKSFYKSFSISSKNAKKQEKKREAEAKMKLAQQIDKEAAKNKDSEKHVEKDSIKRLLAGHRLKMLEIPADGDCMYNALAHQLLEDGVEVSSRKLRKHAATYMREHKDDFAPFIADCDVAESGADPNANWEKYLEGVERTADLGGVWGGELELNAIANIYNKTIVVHKTDGERRMGEQFDVPNERPLHIVFLRRAYHLGEHYNSTVPY